MARGSHTETPVDTSPSVGDEVKCTTCYMCACRCGIRVFLQDGEIRYIQGNRDHPVNKGVLCAKGSAGIMNYKSPARLTKPLKRVGPRGSGEFEEIEWDEALDTAAEWLSRCRYATNPKKLAFFTGRDQSAVPDLLVGPTVRNPELSPRTAASARSTWRLAGIYTHRRRVLGIRLSLTGRRPSIS